MAEAPTIVGMSLQLAGSRSLAGEVAQRIADRIDELGPHTRLGTKDDLRRETGVAAATLNEALRILEHQGLVSMKTGPNGGVFTSAPDPLVRIGQAMVKVRLDSTSIPDAIAVRNALDPLTVVDAAQHRSAAQLKVLRRKLAVVEESTSDDLAFARAIWDFHRAVYVAGRNEILKSVCLGLIETIAEHVTEVVAKTPEQKQARVESHRAILEAIESRDLEACARASLAHEEAENPR